MKKTENEPEIDKYEQFSTNLQVENRSVLFLFSCQNDYMNMNVEKIRCKSTICYVKTVGEHFMYSTVNEIKLLLIDWIWTLCRGRSNPVSNLAHGNLEASSRSIIVLIVITIMLFLSFH